MDNKILEIFIPGPAGRLEAKYFKSKKNTFEKINIELIDQYEINGDFVESQAFGYLAIRSFLNLPISFPSTTGCKEPSTGGVLVENF